MKYYITTAIDYANGAPHLGHVYEKIAADAMARHWRQRGADVFFLTGLDEHGSKIAAKAESQGLSPQAFVDEIAALFQAMWAQLGITYDGFIRTTDPAHKAQVQAIFRRLRDQGDIYKARYEGWYCTGCEAFLAERDLVDGQCPDHQRSPEWITEENYFLRISAYKERIRQWIEGEPDFLQPDTRKNEVLNMLTDFEDVSVTRESVSWGVPVPDETGQTIYVWIDALSNYITAIGYPDKHAAWWPAEMQLVGKDIIKFHAIIWPAILMALDLPLPKTVYGHGWVLAGGRKMGKSVGNVTDPQALIERYTADGLRYFLLREIPFGRDGEITEHALEQRIDADLANNLGNALNRLLPIVDKQFDGLVPDPGEVPSELAGLTASTVDAVVAAMDRNALQDALVAIWTLVNEINRFVDRSAPWALAKDPEKRRELAAALYHPLEALRVVAILSYPFIPTLAQKIWDQLGVGPVADARYATFMEKPLAVGTPVHRLGPIFPRVGSALAGKAKKAQ